MIHSTAVIHPKAKLDSTVRIGPYAVIDEGVEMGPGCTVGPHVHITGMTTIGAHNEFHAGCVIGDAPQDLKYDGGPTRLRIGDHNVFREHVTANRSTTTGEETIIGSHNFLMQHAHVAHNCVVGNHVILASGALLGGYAIVQDLAFISGNCLVHQFARVGTLAMMQGGAAISKDLPPFTLAREYNGICGLNIVGLRRAGFSAEQRLELKQLYRALFRNRQSLKAAIAGARLKFSSPVACTLLDFLDSSIRGVCADAGASSDEL
jgi:UDP-N-acetylglucosamine acyltransferase